MKVKSQFTGKSYSPSSTCRIVNMAQLAFYLANDVELLDLYSSKDKNSEKPILVGVVGKTDSYEAYQKWCDNWNKNGDEN